MQVNGTRREKSPEPARVMLLDRISTGALGAGENLPSGRELVERIGVGRPANREAMQSLETAGLIEIRDGGRARADEPSAGASSRSAQR
jgi:GntR family transcriptional regulator, sialic acid-inducible nan operon repressor